MYFEVAAIKSEHLSKTMGVYTLDFEQLIRRCRSRRAQSVRLSGCLSPQIFRGVFGSRGSHLRDQSGGNGGSQALGSGDSD